MATKTYKFYGKCQWAKVHTVDKEYGHYGIDVFLDKPSMDLFKKSGLRLKVKDYNGEKFVGFRRHPDKVFEGQPGNPGVTDAVGRPLDALVGNGSKVAVTVSVYDTKMGKGHRLETVQVIELVPFGEGPQVEDAHEEYDDDGEAVYQEVEPVAPKKPLKPAPRRAVPQDNEDELPF